MDKKQTAIKPEKKKEQNSGKGSLLELMGLLANIITLMTYCAISPALAEYHGNALIYRISLAVIVIMVIVAIIEFAHLIYGNWEKIYKLCLWIQKKKKAAFLNKLSVKWKVGLLLAATGIIVLTVIFVNYPETSYYDAVFEIYGIPTGIGEPLSGSERKERAFYWEIKNYKRQGRLVLTYVDSYGQMELMREYSTAYSMMFFQPSARIEYKYVEDKKKYQSYSEEGYLVADKMDTKFPDVEEITYYSSSGKTLMKLEKRDYDKYEVTEYSVEDNPQLLNSTLFRTDGQAASDIRRREEDMTSQQIEVSYNSLGMPQQRRLSYRINNRYGVNGEKYVYDKDKRLTALYYLDIDGKPVCNKLGIMMAAFQYEDDGKLHAIRYFSDENGIEKTEGFYGVFCEKFDYESGNLISRKQLNRSENWWYDLNGVYEYQYTYDRGGLTQEAFFGINDKHVRNSQFSSRQINFKMQGNSGIVITFDPARSYLETEEPIAAKQQNEDGRITGGAEKPAADMELLVASQNELSEVLAVNAYVQAEAELVIEDEQSESKQLLAQGSAGSKEQIAERNRKRADSEVLDDAWGMPEDSDRNYISIRYDLNKNNSIKAVSYYDEKGNLVINEEGYASKHLKYDDQQRTIRVSYYDINGKLCMTNDGYAEVESNYDSNKEGKVKERKYLDINGELTCNKKYGYALISYEYLPQGKN